MIRALLKKQLLELGAAFVRSSKTGKRRSRAGAFGYALLFAVLMLLVMLSFGSMALPLAVTLVPQGLDWLYLGLCEDDPYLRVARRFRHRLYRSQVFRVRYQGQPSPMAEGGPYLDAHLQCLNQDGRLVVIGVMGGAQATLNLGLLLVKRIRVMGSTLRSQPLARRAALARALAEHILPAFVRGELRWTLDRQFALPDAAQAHAWVEGNHNKGKVMLLA